ncbi:MAG: hypothetical protein WAL32_06570 [Terriglobales bacterium]
MLELHTQLLIAQELQYLPKDCAERLLGSASGVGRALSGLINSLDNEAAKPTTNDRGPTTSDHV